MTISKEMVTFTGEEKLLSVVRQNIMESKFERVGTELENSCYLILSCLELILLYQGRWHPWLINFLVEMFIAAKPNTIFLA